MGKSASGMEVFEGPHADASGILVKRYDEVRLLDETQIELSTGGEHKVLAGTPGTILFFYKADKRVQAYLEVHPDDQRFGFVSCDIDGIKFFSSAESKLKD